MLILGEKDCLVSKSNKSVFRSNKIVFKSNKIVFGSTNHTCKEQKNFQNKKKQSCNKQQAQQACFCYLFPHLNQIKMLILGEKDVFTLIFGITLILIIFYAHCTMHMYV